MCSKYDLNIPDSPAGGAAGQLKSSQGNGTDVAESAGWRIGTQ